MEKKRILALNSILNEGKGTDFVNTINKMADQIYKSYEKLFDIVWKNIEQEKKYAKRDKEELKYLKQWEENIDSTHVKVERAIEDFIEAAIG